MSSQIVATLAEQWGASEALIQRSADARAAALGSTADAVLTSWSGGAPPATAAPAPVPETVPEPAVPEPAAPEPTAPEPTPEPVESAEGPAAPEEPASVPPEPTPVELPREPDPVPAGSLGGLSLGALVLFVVMFVAVVIAPSSAGNAEELDAVQTIELSDAALHGRDVYLAEGCALCHTQQVRPIVTDADLGIVTLSASPLIPGNQRIGPDLAHVGSRESTGSAGWLAGYLDDPGAFRPDGKHPSYSYLSSRDLENLVAYLVESK